MKNDVKSTVGTAASRALLVIALAVFLAGPYASAKNVGKKMTDFKGILKKVSPSIVKVFTRAPGSRIATYVTGIAVDRKHVISNMEVIRRPYTHIFIQTVENNYYPAKLVGKDTGTSMILLKINKGQLSPIKKAKQGEVGDSIAVVGVFYNKFPSVFHGIVSNVTEEKMLINTPVYPGASGSAVVN